MEEQVEAAARTKSHLSPEDWAVAVDAAKLYKEKLFALLPQERRRELLALEQSREPERANHNEISPLFHAELTADSKERL